VIPGPPVEGTGGECAVSTRQGLFAGSYLPPYSPDLNPIEQAFAKLKALLRAKGLRTVGELWKALGDLVPCFSPAECANFLRHAGYFWSS
jgi:transposase